MNFSGIKKNIENILLLICVLFFGSLSSVGMPQKSEAVSLEIFESQLRERISWTPVELRKEASTFDYDNYEWLISFHDYHHNRLVLSHRLAKDSEQINLENFLSVVDGGFSFPTTIFSPSLLKRTYGSSLQNIEWDTLFLKKIEFSDEQMTWSGDEALLSKSLADKIANKKGATNYRLLFENGLTLNDGTTASVAGIVDSVPYSKVYGDFIIFPANSSLFTKYYHCLSILTDGYFDTDVTLANDIYSYYKSHPKDVSPYFYNFFNNSYGLGSIQQTFLKVGDGADVLLWVVSIVSFAAWLAALWFYFHRANDLSLFTEATANVDLLLSFVLVSVVFFGIEAAVPSLLVPLYNSFSAVGSLLLIFAILFFNSRRAARICFKIEI